MLFFSLVVRGHHDRTTVFLDIYSCHVCHFCDLARALYCQRSLFFSFKNNMLLCIYLRGIFETKVMFIETCSKATLA